MNSEAESEADTPLRWSRLLQQSSDPLFILNRSRRIVFVNRAWEALTGHTFAEARGWVCKHRAGEAPPGSAEALRQTLAPPVDAMEGRTVRVRRRYLESASRMQWWDIELMPLGTSDGLAGLICKITVVPQQISPGPPLPEKIVALRQQVVEWYRLDKVASEVPSVLRMVEQIRQAAQSKAPVTIVGEEGAGKHWAARAIHYRTNPEGTFACVDCAAVPELFLSEFFGESGLAARQGISTLYLKEPGRLPRELQSRVREQLMSAQESAPRIIAGYRGDPLEQIHAGVLLEDFYFLTSSFTVHVPPLRERKADLSWFVDHFLGRLHTAGAPEVTPEAQQVLRAHTWPGNLGELFDVLRSASARTKSSRIEAADLPFYLRSTPAPKERSLPLDSILEQVEKRLMLLALRLSQNNKTKAAELLAIWRPRLVRRLEAFGMPPEAEEAS